MRRFDARRVQGAAVGPGCDVGLGAVGACRDSSADLHLRPAGEAVGEGVRRAEPVALPVVVAGCFHEAGQCGAEAREARPGSSAVGSCPAARGAPSAGTAAPTPRSGPRASPVPADRCRRPARSRGSVTCLMCPRRTTCSIVAEQVELPSAERGRLGHRGHDVSVDPEHDACGLESEEQSSSDSASAAAAIVSAASPSATTGSGWTTARLSIHGSRGPHPGDAIGRHALRQQPDDSVGCGLAGSDDRRTAPEPRSDGAELVDRRRRGRRRRRRRAGAWSPGSSATDRWRRRHDAAPRRRTVSPETRDVTRWDVSVSVVLAPAEEGHPTRADETAMQDVRRSSVWISDRRARSCSPASGPRVLHRTVTEEGRRDAVELRRLVQLDERIGVLPVPARRMATIDEGDVHVGVVDQRVGERHAHGSGADNEVVRLQMSQPTCSVSITTRRPPPRIIRGRRGGARERQ